MLKEPEITLFDLVVCLSDAIDLVSPVLVSHHKQVGYIAYAIGVEYGLNREQCRNLLLAGMLHDIGALSLSERIELMRFEIDDAGRHCDVGARFLDTFEHLTPLSPIVLYHHAWWEERGEKNIPVESYIMHLADRVAVGIDRSKHVIGQAEELMEKVQALSGTVFMPEAVEALVACSKREYFWLDAVLPSVFRVLRRQVRMQTIMLTMDQLTEMSLLFARVIDFRSSFTADHSSGVSATAETLAGLASLSQREVDMMRVAGYLHDLGKLAIPTEILEKPGPLTHEEFNVIRSHTYYTYRILDTLENFDTITTWGAFHHERLNGRGYPFHHTGDDLSLGARIMCVADIFTAVSEDRPYRKGMDKKRVIDVLRSMARTEALDRSIVELAVNHFDELENARQISQKKSADLYRDVIRPEKQ